MKSFIRELDKRFELIESTEYCDACDRPIDHCVCDSEEIDEQNVTGAIAGFNIPAAFSKRGVSDKTAEQLGYKRVKTNESVNTPPSFKWKETEHQRPESDEETSQDKFPFSTGMEKWTMKDQVFPVKFSNQPYGTANIKDTTIKNLKIESMLDAKYEELIESYRNFATGDKTMSPEQKVKSTIKEIAKRLQEIETIVNYNTRLKTESGIAASGYGSSTTKALSKISERLVKISERVRALGE